MPDGTDVRSAFFPLLRMASALALAVAMAARADAATADSGSVTVPWQEFSELFKARLLGQLDEPIAAAPPLTVIETAHAVLRASSDKLTGTLSVRGSHRSGERRPLALVPPGWTVLAVARADGATLSADAGGLMVRAAADEQPFVVELKVALPLARDRHRWRAVLDLPAAMVRSAVLQTEQGWRLVSSNGLQVDGQLHAPPGRELIAVLASEPGVDAGTASAELDLLTTLEVAGQQVLGQTYIHAPAGWPARFSLQVDGAVRAVDDPRFVVRARGPDDSGLSVLEFVIAHDAPAHGPGEPLVVRHRHALSALAARSISPGKADAARYSNARVVLPRVMGNRGSQGNLALRKKPGVSLRLAELPDVVGARPAAGVAAVAPSERAGAELPPALRELLSEDSYVRTAARAVAVRAHFLPRAPAPPVVLDSIGVSAEVAASGRMLMRVELHLPPGRPARIGIHADADARPWRVQLNGVTVPLYHEEQGGWFVERAANAPAGTLVVSYLREAEPLAPEGRLGLLVPALGLAARRLDLTLLLPAGHRLLALDGPLQSAPAYGAHKARRAARTAGRNGSDARAAAAAPTARRSSETGQQGRYRFRHAFYDGRALPVALHYQRSQEQGEQP
ncbi:MAG: hypothetical protein AAF458_22720 [Pseudomonadota bacterium]